MTYIPKPTLLNIALYFRTYIPKNAKKLDNNEKLR